MRRLAPPWHEPIPFEMERNGVTQRFENVQDWGAWLFVDGAPMTREDFVDALAMGEVLEPILRRMLDREMAEA